jgi:transposase
MLLHSKLDKGYRQESNPDVRERIFIVRRIVEDKQHIINVAKELHRCRAWAYKWYKRYNDHGLQGLKDRTRSGRTPYLPKDTMIKIRQELADSKTGWDFRQIMDLIRKTGVRYHEVHIYRLLHKWGFKSKIPQKDLSILLRKRKKGNSKE